MKHNQSAFLIAAPSSHSGKTTVTLGLIQALVNRGLQVQPFKCGPDYIDPMFHSKIAGRPSYNLDTWMTDEQHVTQLFHQHIKQSQVSVVEGAMGLFDGAIKDEGSAASIAKLLNIPVILVMDAKAMAYSAAPILYGFKYFDAGVNVAGVIFNKASGESHYQYLRDAAIDAGVEPLGYLPKDELLIMPSRHLGLTLPDENPTLQLAQQAAFLIEQHIDLNRILEISQYQHNTTNPPSNLLGELTIAIACDEAFCFMYQANIDALKQLGKVTFFSPLHDSILPPADLVWIPGGYPELYAKEISTNTSMLTALVHHVQQNKALVAECGGFMLMGKQLHKNGDAYPMAGLFDYETTLDNMKLSLGYRHLYIDNLTFKGHEFHYSNIVPGYSNAANCRVSNARNNEVDMPLFRYKNVLASYMHLYLGEEEKMSQFLKMIL